MVHVPTFTLQTAPGCLGFTIATVAGPRHGGGRWDEDGEDPGESDLLGVRRCSAQGALLEPESSEEDAWDGIKTVLKMEKEGMLVRVSPLLRA